MSEYTFFISFFLKLEESARMTAPLSSATGGPTFAYSSITRWRKESSPLTSEMQSSIWPRKRSISSCVYSSRRSGASVSKLSEREIAKRILNRERLEPFFLDRKQAKRGFEVGHAGL